MLEAHKTFSVELSALTMGLGPWAVLVKCLIHSVWSWLERVSKLIAGCHQPVGTFVNGTE